MKPDIRVTLRKPEVMKALGISQTHLEDLVALGVLPAPFKLSPNGRVVGWDGEAIAKYQEQQRKQTVSYKADAPRLTPLKRLTAAKRKAAK